MDSKNKQTKQKPQKVASTNYSREGGRVRDTTKCYITLCRTGVDKGTPVAMDKNPEKKNRGD